MPRRPMVIQKWTAEDIKQQSTISGADIQHADEAWRRDARRDARELLHALPEEKTKRKGKQ